MLKFKNPYADNNKVIKDDSYEKYQVMVTIGIIAMAIILFVGFWY